MGSVLSAVGKGIGSVFGSIGGGVAEGAGAINQFQAGNPYAASYLQQLISNQGQIYGQQQNLARALQAQMNGQGPNPAQTQYLANNQNNIANAQGLIASQRGLNPALAARMGANVAAKANQEAALGSALLQQQQQLAATSNYGNLLGQMQQGNQGYQNLYTTGNSGAQSINANIAGQNTKVRADMASGLMNAATAAGTKAATGGKAHGGVIEGKAKVPGDSPANDTVHAMLSPGEIVIPRSAAQDPEKAKEFIDHLLKGEKKSKASYGDVLKARRKKSA